MCKLALNFFLVVTIWVGSPFLICAQDTTNISWNLEPGTRFEVELVQDTKVDSEFNLVRRSVQTKVLVVMNWTVSSVAQNGDAAILQTISRIDLNMDSPTPEGNKNIEVSTQSQGKPDDEIAGRIYDQLTPLIGAEFTVTLASNGTVKEVVAAPKTMQILRDIPGSMKMRELITENGIRDMFSRSLVELPKSEFTAGETWSATRNLPSELGVIASSDQYKFIGIENREGASCAKISVNSTSSVDNAPKEQKTRFVGGEGQGTLWFSLDAGFFSECEFRSEFATRQDYRDTGINTQTTSTSKMTMVQIVGQN